MCAVQLSIPIFSAPHVITAANNAAIYRVFEGVGVCPDHFELLRCVGVINHDIRLRLRLVLGPNLESSLLAIGLRCLFRFYFPVGKGPAGVIL